MKFHPNMTIADMPDNAPVGIVCALNAVLIEPLHEGDTLRPCGGCLRTVRLAPSSQALLADAERRGRDVVVRCFDCARPTMGKPDTEFGLAAGAVDEIITRIWGEK